MTGVTRQQFLAALAGGAIAGGAVPATARGAAKRPRAITMWDFSWLERRWPGAGYEDWDAALDALVARGYDAVRIDVYPHLIAAGGTRSWLLKPVWNNQDWGAPAPVRVAVLPALHDFLSRCRRRGIKVALSTWFREDEDNVRQRIAGPADLAGVWRATLRSIADAGLLDTILYVDLCNEWPGPIWATFLDPPLDWGAWRDPRSLSWMREAIGALRRDHPDLPFLFSGTAGSIADYATPDARIMDAIEYHIWMVNANGSEFTKAVGYKGDRFTDEGYHNVQRNAAALYASGPAHWRKLLTDQIDRAAAASRTAGLPLMTTECWGIVDYKDWPMMPWDWVRDLCEIGTLAAARTGRWLAIATSNFCGPQFEGMWRDVAWHRRLTRAIKAAPIDAGLRSGLLWDRL